MSPTRRSVPGSRSASLTQLPILFLHSLPWETLSPVNDALRVDRHAAPDLVLATRHPGYEHIHDSRHHPITAVFPVPPAVRPLLQAVRCFAAESDNTTGRRVRLDEFHL
ncbi:hypothetical protein MDOR_33210 [Mycolicibacterium doricum]|uniref:Uncharacterized protein n=1 Tax=Mycolicibacterium doricum TaxID=126673 RepID=A0A1X1TIG6_9MYCO|nr:hypothetical protein [Mycolicibacterium doricum]MCV7267983.1 hypothetical protein [Mycolicibacterium doricum]ORV44375.1 hypothetical protein AWC01_03630 [Mycolicibacterium doricum]BBZ09152.1 hypothetical protein MDOR_33210 [Mycolicibacterium doricum]